MNSKDSVYIGTIWHGKTAKWLSAFEESEAAQRTSRRQAGAAYLESLNPEASNHPEIARVACLFCASGRVQLVLGRVQVSLGSGESFPSVRARVGVPQEFLRHSTLAYYAIHFRPATAQVSSAGGRGIRLGTAGVRGGFGEGGCGSNNHAGGRPLPRFFRPRASLSSEMMACSNCATAVRQGPR